jgi:hypothetical protein
LNFISESYKETRLSQLQRKHSLVLNPLSICKYFAYICLPFKYYINNLYCVKLYYIIFAFSRGFQWAFEVFIWLNCRNRWLVMFHFSSFQRFEQQCYNVYPRECFFSDSLERTVSNLRFVFFLIVYACA